MGRSGGHSHIGSERRGTERTGRGPGCSSVWPRPLPPRQSTEVRDRSSVRFGPRPGTSPAPVPRDYDLPDPTWATARVRGGGRSQYTEIRDACWCAFRFVHIVTIKLKCSTTQLMLERIRYSQRDKTRGPLDRAHAPRADGDAQPHMNRRQHSSAGTRMWHDGTPVHPCQRPPLSRIAHTRRPAPSQQTQGSAKLGLGDRVEERAHNRDRGADDTLR